MATTWFEQGVEKGIEKGMQLGEFRILEIILQGRFGPLTVETKDRLKSMTPEQLKDLAEKLSRATDLKDLGLGRAE